MPEFKIEGEALRRQARFRVLSWGTILLLLGTTVLLFLLGISGVLSAYQSLRLLFVFTLLGTVIGSCVLACLEALHYAKRQMVFVLESNEVIRQRRGYPELRISFSEIDTLSEELGWLIIKSAAPERRIVIPDSVNGYGVIRAELAKHHPLSAHVSFPLKGAVVLLVSVLSWGAVFWFSDVRTVSAAGIVAVVTLANGSYRLWVLLHRSSRRLLWMSLGAAWLAALMLIYLRMSGF